MFQEVGYSFYWFFVAPVLRVIFRFLEDRFPDYFEPLYEVVELSGRLDGKMTLLYRDVFEYDFSEQFSQMPNKRLISKYRHP